MNHRPSFLNILFRTLTSKCPVCGEGKLFSKLNDVQSGTDLFIPLKNCNRCQFQFARQSGYYFGVVTPVLPILALFTGAFFAGTSYFGFHTEAEDALYWGGAGIIVGVFLFFRPAIALYIAIDHAIDPPQELS
jgi:hypothetical protein